MVSFIAQEAATRERFLSDFQSLDDALPHHLKDAEDRQIVLVVLVDPWSLTLENYRKMIAPCDELRPFCAIIVTWNAEDKEAESSRPLLQVVLGQSLPRVAVAIRHPAFFRDSPDSRARLQGEIQATVTEVYMRMLQARSAKLGLTADPPPSVSNAQGVPRSG